MIINPFTDELALCSRDKELWFGSDLKYPLGGMLEMVYLGEFFGTQDYYEVTELFIYGI